jgi:hypothetical protein
LGQSLSNEEIASVIQNLLGEQFSSLKLALCDSEAIAYRKRNQQIRELFELLLSNLERNT